MGKCFYIKSASILGTIGLGLSLKTNQHVNFGSHLYPPKNEK